MKKYYLIISVIIVLVTALFLFQKKETKIIFVGDMFFDRSIRKVMYAKGGDYVFSCMSDFLKNSDLVVGNLEGPITESASKSLLSQVETPDNYTFTFPTNVPHLLYKNNIRLVNLGNNHIGNFGKEGIASTKKYLSEAKVNYFGGLNSDEPIFREGKLSFISYNEFGGESAQKVAEKIVKEKESGQTVIVYTHWGEEYVPATARVKNVAKLFAKSGASLIVGSHPHVIQESEKIISPQPSLYPKERVTTVYYSLGNFIFDQYWNKEVSTGLVLEAKIEDENLPDGKAGIEILEHRVSINRDGRTCLID
jgi:poly-gamma-glutamate synthesis protein (capsule biosynthesis protein)